MNVIRWVEAYSEYQNRLDPIEYPHIHTSILNSLRLYNCISPLYEYDCCVVELYGLDDRNGMSIRMGYSHIKGVSFHIYLESSLVTWVTVEDWHHEIYRNGMTKMGWVLEWSSHTWKVPFYIYLESLMIIWVTVVDSVGAILVFLLWAYLGESTTGWQDNAQKMITT